MTSLLEVRDISRRFGETTALDGISLDIAENEFFALLGPSGCGKTTLLRTIAGFEHPDSGDILLDGQDLLALPPHRRPVNLMFQSYALFPHLDVRRNIAFGLEREKLAKAEIAERVDEVIETVGLTHLAKRRPAQLSGGQRQRVALARAIVKRPRLLLLDEPLSALDRKVRAEMQLELKRLQHEVGITFVVVTHDQDEALSMADRIAVFSAGHIQQIGTPEDLYQRPANLFVADFIGTSNAIPGVAGEDGFASDEWGALPGTVPAGVTGPCHLVVRPEVVRLVDPAAGTVRGTVLETQFRGGTSTVAVSTPGQQRPLIVTVPGTARIERDAPIGLVWDADDAHVVTGSLA